MRATWTVVLALAIGLAIRQAGAEAKFIYVDLQSQANHRLSEDLHDSPGNHFGNLPQGELKFEESRFKIGGGMLRLLGKAGSPKAPTRIKDIKVGAKFDRLHILHSTGYGENPQMPEGTEIGAYTVVYEGGQEERIPIVYGEDLRDWWDWPGRSELKRAKVAWTGANPAAAANERKIRAFAVIWKNPHPDRLVKTLEVSSSETNCDPMVFAFTLETR